MLADLITVAVNSALDAAAADSEKEMGELTGGLDLGGLLG
jgi:DNA-binding protein YbaB